MGRRSRRWLATALLACVVLVGAGCASKPARDTGGPPRIAFLISTATLNFGKEMVAGFDAGVRKTGGVQHTIVGPPLADPSRQVAMFEETSRTAPAGIAVAVIAPELFARPLAAAAEKGIPLLAVDAAPAPSSRVTSYVGNDNTDLGRLLAVEAIKHLPPDASGTVVLGSPSPGLPLLDARAKGMREEFARRLPKVRVRGAFDTNNDPNTNLAAWGTLVRANPHALAFLGTGDADSVNLAQIRKRTHGRWLAGAFDLDPRALDGVKDGELFAVVSPEHFLKGAIAGQLEAEQAKHGKALPKGWIYTPGLAVTKANVDQIIARQRSPAAKAAWFTPKIELITGNMKDYLRPLETAR